MPTMTYAMPGSFRAAQRVEHYEMGDNGAAELLGATLNEESATDKKLTEVAMSVVNIKAAN